MAKQAGFGMIIGSIGDLTFYESNGRFYVRKKGSMTAKRVHEAPEFERTRENNREFQRAMQHGQGIRRALSRLCYGIMERGNSGYLASKLVRCIQQNPVGARGERQLYLPTLPDWLRGHEFNRRSALVGNFPMVESGGVSVMLDRVSGQHRIEVAGFDSVEDVLAPGAADQFNFVAGIAAWDGTMNCVQGQWWYGWRGVSAESEKWEVSRGQLAGVTLNLNFDANDMRPLVVVFGLRYWYEENGAWERVAGGRFDCLGVVGVGV